MQAESPLSDEVLRQALDAAPDGIAVVDATGAIVFVNPMLEKLFEYPRDELVGRSVDMLLPESSRSVHAGHRADYAAHPRTRSMGTGLDLQGRRRSGDEFPIEISLSPLRTGDGLLVIAIVRDVTERRAADEELQQVREALALVDDRERIARDLHDTVIQRLFAVGLSLQAALTRAVDDPAVERIQLAVDEIDVTIRDIRSSIFALHTRRTFAASARDDVLAIAREAGRALGFEPTVRFDGPVDSVATDEMREQVLATLREALSNVTRHAYASTVNIDLVADARRIMLRVRDDGIGIQSPAIGNGLRNMSERATALGGSCEVTRSSAAGGVQIEWQIPVGETTT
jgi:two-component system, NarL family, sensor histidine kinase DevS